MQVKDSTGSTASGRVLLVVQSLVVLLILAAPVIGFTWLSLQRAEARPGDSATMFLMNLLGVAALSVPVLLLVGACYQAVVNRRVRLLRERFPGLPVLCAGWTIDLSVARKRIARSRGEIVDSLPSSFEVVASSNGLSFWRGFREPTQFFGISWDEVESIRIDRTSESGGRFLAITFESRIGESPIAIPVRVDNPRMRLIGHENVGQARELAHEIAALAPQRPAIPTASQSD